jgi:hypothetical protein
MDLANYLGTSTSSANSYIAERADNMYMYIVCVITPPWTDQM